MQCFCFKTLVVFSILCAFTNGATAACLKNLQDGTVSPPMRNIAMLETQVGGRKLMGWSASGVYVLLGGGQSPCPSGLRPWVTRPVSLPAKIGDYGGYNIYPTEYSSIGYIARSYGYTWGDAFSGPLDGARLSWHHAGGGIGIRHEVSFVLLGQILPGTYTLARRQFARLVISTHPSNSATPTSLVEYVGFPVYYAGTTFTVTGNTCTIDAGDKNKTVTMPSVNKNQFSGVGSTVGAQSFSMKLECGASITVSAGMTDVSLPSNSSNILTLSGDSTAAGVGYQLHVNNSATPVIFGSGVDTKNLWSVGGSSSAPATTYDIPFTASYVQTDSNITAGTANAMSTILLSYK